jgi:hypothetical protein
LTIPKITPKKKARKKMEKELNMETKIFFLSNEKFANIETYDKERAAIFSAIIDQEGYIIKESTTDDNGKIFIAAER